MKKILFLYLILGSFLVTSCSKNNEGGTGTIQFKMTNPGSTKVKSGFAQNAAYVNPPLTGDVTETLTTSIKLRVGDVWVSQGVIRIGEADNLKWVRLTDATNQECKLFENYTFPPKELPAGTYKSIKMTFGGLFYRLLSLRSDPTVKYEIAEAMGSSILPCDLSDNSLGPSYYFSTDGNHIIENGVFKMANRNEKVGGFTVVAGKTVKVSWRLGAGVTVPCTNFLYDINKNRIWDCGIDDLGISCPPEVQLMWDFVVE